MQKYHFDEKLKLDIIKFNLQRKLVFTSIKLFTLDGTDDLRYC